MTDEMSTGTGRNVRLDPPRLDLAGSDGAARTLLSRLRRSNKALDSLRHALEADENELDKNSDRRPLVQGG